MRMTWALGLVAAVASVGSADFEVGPLAEGTFNLSGPDAVPSVTAGPFDLVEACFRPEDFREVAYLFDLGAIRAAGGLHGAAYLTVHATGWVSMLPPGPMLYAEGFADGDGALSAGDFTYPGAGVAIASAVLPSAGSAGDGEDYGIAFDVTAFLAAELASGASFAGILLDARQLDDSVRFGGTSGPGSLRPVLSVAVPGPGGLVLLGLGLVMARIRRRARP
jgi:hypothetical protein